LGAILGDRPMAAGSEAIVLVNGLGGTPLSELYRVFGEVVKEFGKRGRTIARSLVGDYGTSLDMGGCSRTGCQDEPDHVELCAAQVITAALRWGVERRGWEPNRAAEARRHEERRTLSPPGRPPPGSAPPRTQSRRARNDSPSWTPRS